MFRRSALLVAGFLLMLPGLATAQSAARMQAARTYFSLPAVQKVYLETSGEEFWLSQVAPVFFPDSSQLTRRQRQRVLQVIARHWAALRPTYERVMIESYARTFTVRELDAMTAYAMTPDGASATEKSGRLAIDLATALKPYVEAQMRAAASELRASPR